jgi:hypothetical protein
MSTDCMERGCKGVCLGTADTVKNSILQPLLAVASVAASNTWNMIPAGHSGRWQRPGLQKMRHKPSSQDITSRGVEKVTTKKVTCRIRKTHDSQFDLDCAKCCAGEESKNSLVGRGNGVSWQFPPAFVSGGLHQAAHSSHAFWRQSVKLLNPCRVLARGTHRGQKGSKR